MLKFRHLTLAALALGLLGAIGPAASAFPVTPPGFAQPASPDLIVPAREVLRGGVPRYSGNNYYRPRYNYPLRYNYRRYGGYPFRYYARPCYGWNGYCGPYFPYNGYYGGPFIGFGFGPGFYVAPQRYASVGSRHVRWCKNRYKSYKPRSNTWVSYSGKVRECVSPYGP